VGKFAIPKDNHSLLKIFISDAQLIPVQSTFRD
jgi:hypothetical protein